MTQVVYNRLLVGIDPLRGVFVNLRVEQGDTYRRCLLMQCGRLTIRDKDAV